MNVLPQATGLIAGLSIAAGVHAVLRAREWPARERLGAWVIAIQLWVLSAVLFVIGIVAR